MMILSGDAPRGWALRGLLIVVVAALALAPFLFPGAKALSVAGKNLRDGAARGELRSAARLCRHRLLRACDVLRHRLLWRRAGAVWHRPGLGRARARRRAARSVFAVVLALAIGLFSLRVQSIFFAMVTLAVAYAFNVLASQLSDVTGGEDGRSFKIPPQLLPGFKLGELAGVAHQRPHALLLPRVRGLRAAVPGAAARGQFAVRPRACRRSARTRFAPRRWAIASCSTARSRPASRRRARRRRGRSTRSGCATSGPTRR